MSACFDSIKKSSHPFEKIETILADNASADNSVSFEIKDYPWVRVLALDKNYGIAKGNNIGARNDMGKYIVN